VDLREVKEERADTTAVDLTTDTLSQTDTTAAKAAKEERVDTTTDSKKNAKLFASTTNTTTIHLLCVSGSVVYKHVLFICSATTNHKFLTRRLWLGTIVSYCLPTCSLCRKRITTSLSEYRK